MKGVIDKINVLFGLRESQDVANNCKKKLLKSYYT